MKKVFIGVLAALMLFAFVACDNQAAGTGAALRIYSEDCPVYVEGQKVNLADWTIKGVDVYGNIVSVSAPDLIVADTALTDGQKTVQVSTPWGASGTLDVKVLPVTKIAVEAEGAKDEYFITVGTNPADRFMAIDSTGVVVTATYTDEDGVSQELVVDNSLCDFKITDWTAVDPDASVTVSYGGESASYPVALVANGVKEIEIEVAEDYEPIAASNTTLDTSKFVVYGIYENGERLALTADTDVRYSIDTIATVDKKTYDTASKIDFSVAGSYTVYVKYVGANRAEGMDKYANESVSVVEDSLSNLKVAINALNVPATYDYTTNYPTEITVVAEYKGSTSDVSLAAKTDYVLSPLKYTEGLETGDTVIFTITPVAGGKAAGLDPVSFRVTIGTALTTTIPASN